MSLWTNNPLWNTILTMQIEPICGVIVGGANDGYEFPVNPKRILRTMKVAGRDYKLDRVEEGMAYYK